MSALCAMRLPEGTTSLEQARCLEIIDCLQLPHTIQWHQVRTTEEAFQAIKSMRIRGAPAIASLAAVAIALELLAFLDEPSSATLQDGARLQAWLEDKSNYLLSSRPTAVNLREAMHRLQAVAAAPEPADVAAKARKIYDAAELVWTEDVERNHRIGDNGASWLLKKLEGAGTIKADEQINVLTVCNTGSLATSVGLPYTEEHVLSHLTHCLLGLHRATAQH
jgi:methylthioribose-1-phosphate isomerase